VKLRTLSYPSQLLLYSKSVRAPATPGFLRGVDEMANEQNLVSLATRSQRERSEIARKGQEASAKAKRENKLIRDRILERMGEDDWDTMIDKLIERATIDTKSFEVLRDTIGQKPKEQVQVDNKMVFTFGDDDDEADT
jgi:hypothetical protein